MTYQYDTSWQSLVRPYLGSTYFQFQEMVLVDIDETALSLKNALLMSELSRLVYRIDDKRELFLSTIGLTEVSFISEPLLQCSVVTPTGGNPSYLIVVFRGSSCFTDWLTNFNFVHHSLDRRQRVHSGFWRALNSVWPQLDKILQAYQCPVYFTGHSLGGAVATLASLQYKATAVYTFGAPRVGNAEVARRFNQTNCYRFMNDKDIVPKVPPKNCIDEYRHGGKVITLYHYNTLPDSAMQQFRLPQRLTDHSPINYSNGIANTIIAARNNSNQ